MSESKKRPVGRPPGKRNYKGQPNATPMRRIMMARGLTLIEVAVLSGVSLDTVRKLDRLEPDSLGQLTVRKLLKIAQFFEVAPSDLLPYLNVAVKKKKPSV